MIESIPESFQITITEALQTNIPTEIDTLLTLFESLFTLTTTFSVQLLEYLGSSTI